MFAWIDLVVLVTDPAHERKGAGKMLLEWGCKKADEQGLDAYLDATPIGRPLYQRYGFVIERESDIDLAQFGAKGSAGVTNMVRRAGPKADTNGTTNGIDDRSAKALGA